MKFHMNRRGIDLSGDWFFRLDPDDDGVHAKWYSSALADEKVVLPGTTATNGIGEGYDFDGTLSRRNVQQMKQHHCYVGAAWYQRDLHIPEDWVEGRFLLALERVMFSSDVWVNDSYIGRRDSLSTGHCYDLAGMVRPGGVYRLTVRIDNRDIKNIGRYASAYTDESQTIWNGIVGDIALYNCPMISIDNVKATFDYEKNLLTLDVDAYSHSKLDSPFKIEIDLREKESDMLVLSASRDIVGSSENKKKLQIPLDLMAHGEIKYWDEYTPNLYVIDVHIRFENGGQAFHDKVSFDFGFRDVSAKGRRLLINGRPLFLRGTLDCCIFPLTGHPSMDKQSWRKIFDTVKAYGLNHVRYHSWCPPEAAFSVADELGLYLLIEGPVWMDNWANLTVGDHEAHYDYLPEEAKRIVAAYGNHPSFCFFSNGNELNGDFDLLRDMIRELKAEDGRFLYTLTSNWDRKVDTMDDIFITQSVDGVGVRGQYYLDKMAEGTRLNFSKAVAMRDMPIISHEVGQYCVYPNVNEIDKFSGVIRPVNYEAIRRDLEEKGLLSQVDKFLIGSGLLALQLYKDEIEAALRTEDFGGFQLLGLQDYPGHSTATVGLLDCFWDSKGIVSPNAFREFCSETVCLLEVDKRCYMTDEAFVGDVKIAHFGHEDLRDQKIRWTITGDNGQVFFEGHFEAVDIRRGKPNCVGKIKLDSFEGILESTHVTLAITIAGTCYRNSWDLWIYPVHDENELSNDLLCFTQWGQKAEEALKAGKKVLLVPSADSVKTPYMGNFFPVFWSPVHFASKDSCGIFCDRKHPVFKDFPTDSYGSYQWKDLLERSISISLDALPEGFELITQVIPNFYCNHKQGVMFEAQVGKGKLIVCGVDIVQETEAEPMIRNMKRSIYNYINSTSFAPEQVLSFDELELIFTDVDAMPSQARKDLAKGKNAASDCEKSAVYGADKGNDGNPLSAWQAADADLGHWWEVDLGEMTAISGIRVEFPAEANYLYVIQVSDDGADYRMAANKTGQTQKLKVHEDDFEECSRFVRIVYNGLPSGVWASHVSFQVYGVSQ